MYGTYDWWYVIFNETHLMTCCQFFSSTLHTKSLYRSRAGRHFYGTENVIWAGFGPIGNTEKKSLGRLWATFEDVFFMFSGEKKNLKFFFENVVVSAQKSCIISIWEKKIIVFFLPLKTWKNRPQIGLNSQSIVYCSIGDTSLRDFYIMTLCLLIESIFHCKLIF